MRDLEWSEVREGYGMEDLLGDRTVLDLGGVRWGSPIACRLYRSPRHTF